METFGLIFCFLAFVFVGTFLFVISLKMVKILDRDIEALHKQEDSKKQSNVAKE